MITAATGLSLLPAHLEDLRTSGLTDETIPGGGALFGSPKWLAQPSAAELQRLANALSSSNSRSREKREWQINNLNSAILETDTRE